MIITCRLQHRKKPNVAHNAHSACSQCPIFIWYQFNTAPCSTGQLRIVGANITNAGRVEICLGNVCGTVCDNGWTTADAAVVCSQLGYSREGESAFVNIKAQKR